MTHEIVEDTHNIINRLMSSCLRLLPKMTLQYISHLQHVRILYTMHTCLQNTDPAADDPAADDNIFFQVNNQKHAGMLQEDDKTLQRQCMCLTK
jgi:hypothetical protein